MFPPFNTEFTDWLKLSHYENLNEIIFSKTDYGEDLKMRALEEIKKDPSFQNEKIRSIISEEMTKELISSLLNLENNNLNNEKENNKKKKNKKKKKIFWKIKIKRRRRRRRRN
uniref:Uncharacterized protein n=1 Tax=Meloidogyne enterolobii TaxID=390850 RepID=A0A6V7U575_MELEN|nr:unnamed protein product [Meloidogyne enterolobii]